MTVYIILYVNLCVTLCVTAHETMHVLYVQLQLMYFAIYLTGSQAAEQCLHCHWHKQTTSLTCTTHVELCFDF